MSSTDDSPEAVAEESIDQAGGLGEVIPEPLLPVWRRIELVQSFRQTHGETYTGALEVLVGLALAAGYIWWLILYL
ncbi:hypothetical protein [Halopiger aswanensis]|uniref:Uncharacterized protein n=1 Tax=Halopiger aswanensis TaxID=148449 RepID=A0A3R7HW30_9EURY|nr:hypothetical protein [Halopiger aswanensis]RKD89336.1 hypothetical protein ATJ93_4170 [Halopiger aswanensis]